VIARLECIVHRRKADIPDMLTIVSHAWMPDTKQWRVIALLVAGREKQAPEQRTNLEHAPISG
jgi:hypothetical protein